jgi:purine-binding chemotaxis protein CheW
MPLQLITFEIVGQSLGIEIGAVREIRAWTAGAPLPGVPPYISGLINLRGVMIPVIDLRERIGWGKTVPTDRHVIIVVQIGPQLHGLTVDAVNDIVAVDESALRPVPDMNDDAARRFIRCLATHDDQMMMIMELDRLAGDAAEDESAPRGLAA